MVRGQVCFADFNETCASVTVRINLIRKFLAQLTPGESHFLSR